MLFRSVWDQDEETYICDFIRFCRPDVLLVALGAPRQDVWIRDHIEELGVPVSIGVGCTLDVLSGGTPRAPRWMRRTGLEWLYRLSSEPGRLWKRYLLDLPLFAHLLLLAARDRLTGRNTRRTVLPNSLQGGAP